jgi:hypothetical protein
MSQHDQGNNDGRYRVLHDRISQLQADLIRAQDHHRKYHQDCTSNTPIPALIESSIPENDAEILRAKASHPNVAAHQPSTQFVIYNPSSAKRTHQPVDSSIKKARRGTKSWWKQWTDPLLTEVSSRIFIEHADCEVLGIPLVPVSDESKLNDTNLISVTGNRGCSDKDFLLYKASIYAGKVKSDGIRAAFEQMAFVSLCVVLIDHGISDEEVNKVMRICITDSTYEHLRRLRSAATWFNSIISDLQSHGWGGKASAALIMGTNPRQRTRV